MIDRIMYFLLILFALASNISTGVTSFVIVLGIILSLIKLIIQKEKIIFDKNLFKMIILFSIIEIIVGVFGIHPIEGIKQAFSEIYRFSPLFFTTLFIKNKKQLGNIVFAFALSLLLNSFYGLYQFAVLDILRPTGFNNTATFYASHLLMGIFFLYSILRDDIFQPWQKKIFYFISLFSVIMLFLSGTRGGWIALISTILLLIYLCKIIKKEFLIIITVVFLSSSIAFVALPNFKERVFSILDTKVASNTERILMWKSAIEIFKDNPIHGIGHNSFKEVYNIYYISPEAKEVGHTHPHNNFLKILAEGGVIGAIGYVSFYLYLTYYFYKKYKYNYSMWGLAAIAIIFSIQIEGLTDWNTGQVPIMREFWFLLGLVIANDNLKINA